MEDQLVEQIRSAMQQSYDEGFKDGWVAATHQLMNHILAFLERQEPAQPEPVVAPQNGGADKPPAVSSLQPHLRAAHSYLREHPGVRAHQARGIIRNRNAFSLLVRLGLAEKRGAQFYALSEVA